MEPNDFIRIVDVQRMNNYNNDILNVYNFQVFTMSDPGTLMQVVVDDIADAFISTVLAYIRPLQVGSLTHRSLRMVNLSNTIEIAEYVYPIPLAGGAGSDEAITAQVAYTFKLGRYDRATRNGGKRIAGVPETAISNSRDLSPAFFVSVEQAETALKSPLTVEFDGGGGMVLSPTIVTVPKNPGVFPTRYSAVLDVEFRGFGTQNSRKRL